MEDIFVGEGNMESEKIFDLFGEMETEKEKEETQMEKENGREKNEKGRKGLHSLQLDEGKLLRSVVR